MNQKKSKIITGLIISALFLVIASCAVIPACAADTQPTFQFSDINVYPKSLMPGDSGTISFTITSTSTQKIYIDKILIQGSDGFVSTTDNYVMPSGAINPGDRFAFSVPITSNGKAGIFYPAVYIDFIKPPSDYIKYPFAVFVDNKEPIISVINRPDYFEPGVTQSLTISIGNPRTNDIEGAEITVSGDGVTSREGSVFAGTIASGTEVTKTITVMTTDESKNVKIDLYYRNGVNPHKKTLIIPLKTGTSKTSAELVINAVEIECKDGVYSITGDVNNAGLSTARSVVVTTNGTTPYGQYPSYVIGSLDEDGLSGFEVSFKDPKSESVEIIIKYKDEFGNEYFDKESLSLTSAINHDQSSGMNAVIATVLIIIAVIAVIAVGIIVWKKGKLISRK
ncbi:MAG TPA: hypothetical protein O0W90_04775 [Methanocorpusculum sp.]|nr:hypothetical protein [Methanocorpusculum sp.]